jgi:hypothetical protein
MNRKGVHAARQFAGQRAVDHAVAFQPSLPFERLRHDINTKMRLPARSVSSMAFVLVRFVQHLETLWRESLGQLFRDYIARLHTFRRKYAARVSQWLLRSGVK